MVVTDQDYTVRRGARAVHTIDVDQDVTGWTARYTWAHPSNVGAALVDLTTGAGVELTTPATGIITATITAALNPVTMPTGPLNWELFKTNAGSEGPVASGQIWIIGGANDAT